MHWPSDCLSYTILARNMTFRGVELHMNTVVCADAVSSPSVFDSLNQLENRQAMGQWDRSDFLIGVAFLLPFSLFHPHNTTATTKSEEES